MATAVLQRSATRRSRKSRRTEAAAGPFSPDLTLRLHELIEGRVGSLRMFSKALSAEICFVNPALEDPARFEGDCPVYTTRELAFVLSLTPEELRRYHHLKSRLI